MTVSDGRRFTDGCGVWVRTNCLIGCFALGRCSTSSGQFRGPVVCALLLLEPTARVSFYFPGLVETRPLPLRRFYLLLVLVGWCLLWLSSSEGHNGNDGCARRDHRAIFESRETR